MPLYGQSFTLSDPANTGLNSPSPKPGTAGKQTRAAGFLAYYEVWTTVDQVTWDTVQGLGLLSFHLLCRVIANHFGIADKHSSLLLL